MKVKDAKKEVEHIEACLSIISELPYKEMNEMLDKYIRTSYSWENISLHVINAMAAYKNILKDRIENAEIFIEGN